MTPAELYDLFRTDITDVARPYLWTDEEVFSYMDSAHKQFVRLTMGIGDFTSVATVVNVDTGDPLAYLHPSILRIREATLASNGRQVKIINIEDGPALLDDDYGQMRQLIADYRSGPVSHMIIGMEKNKARWVKVPEFDDTVNLVIYRMPLNTLTLDTSEEFVFEIEERHHRYLLEYMKCLAFRKNDAETFDRGRSQECDEQFARYCNQSLAEWERSKHKTRVVAYGGL